MFRPVTARRSNSSLIRPGSSNSNESFTVSLFQGDEEVELFNPEFTYPIYGEEEVIFGYQDLEINLAFAAHNLKPHLSIKYTKKFPPQGEIHASDVREPLKDFLPAVAFSETSRKTAHADPNAAEFTPPGERLDSFSTKNGTYEVWCASLADPAAQEILLSMQILVPMSIEGGTILELEYPWIVERWKLFLLYKITDDTPSNVSPYIFAGYATSFQVFTFPARGQELEDQIIPLSDEEIEKIVNSSIKSKDTLKSPLTLPSRERISQFILLPSHRGSGVGSRLYSTVYNHLTAPSNIIELTVEDPNECFDDMRDISDLVHLRSANETFASLSVPTTISKESLNTSAPIPIEAIVPATTRQQLAKDSKIQPRQLSRLIEMQLLSTIPRPHRSPNRITRRERASNEHDRAYYFWRLFVKERLYQHNRDTLAQLDPQERVEKVDDAVESVRADYDRLLEAADKRAKLASGTAKKSRKRATFAEDLEQVAGEDGVSEGAAARRKKRKRVLDDDEAEEDGEEDGEGAPTAAAGEEDGASVEVDL